MAHTRSVNPEFPHRHGSPLWQTNASRQSNRPHFLLPEHTGRAQGHDLQAAHHERPNHPCETTTQDRELALSGDHLCESTDTARVNTRISRALHTRSRISKGYAPPLLFGSQVDDIGSLTPLFAFFENIRIITCVGKMHHYVLQCCRKPYKVTFARAEEPPWLSSADVAIVERISGNKYAIGHTFLEMQTEFNYEVFEELLNLLHRW